MDVCRRERKESKRIAGIECEKFLGMVSSVGSVWSSVWPDGSFALTRQGSYRKELSYRARSFDEIPAATRHEETAERRKDVRPLTKLSLLEERLLTRATTRLR